MSNLDLNILLKLVDKASKPLQSFMRNTEQTDSALDQLIASIDQLDKTLNNNRGLNNYSKQLQNVRNEANLTQKTFSTLGTGFKKAWDGIDYAQSKVEKFQQSLADSRAEMRQEFKGIAIGTGVVGTGLYQLLKPAIAFEQQMSRVQAILDLDKTSADMDKLTKSAREWGAASSFSPTEAAQAQHALASAGFTTNQVLDALGGTLQLAEAGQVELARAAQIAAGTLNGFGLQAKEITRVNDVMLRATDLTATSVDGFGETMKYVAPIAKAYGATLEETSAMIGLLGNNNILDTQAGTSLRAIMTRFAAPPKEAQKVIDKFNLTLTDSKGNLLDMSDIFEEINRKTKNLGEAERLEIYKKLGGQEAISAFATLVDQSAVVDENTGQAVNKLKELTKQLERSQGAAAKAAAIIKDNLAGDLEQLKGGVEDLSVSLLNALGGNLRNAVQGFTQFIEKIKQWIDANPELVKRIADLLVKLLMFKLAMLSIKYSFNLFLGSIVSIFAGITKLGIIAFITSAILAKFGIGFWGRMGLLAKGFSWLARGALFLARNALPLVLTGLRMLATSMLANPLVWIGTAIALVARLIIKYWQPITAFFSGFATGLMQGMAPALDRFKQIWQNLQPVLAPLMPLWNGIVHVLGFLKYLLVSLFQPLDATKAEIDAVSQSGQTFGFWLGTIIGFITDLIAILIQGGVAAFIAFGTAIGETAGWIVVTFSKIPIFFQNTWNSIKGFFNSSIANISATILNWSPLGLFYQVFAKVMSYFGIDLPAKFTGFGAMIIDGLKKGITSKIDSLKATFSKIMSNLPDWAKKILDIHSPSRVFEQIGNFTMQGLANGINNTANQPLAATANVAQALPQHTAKVQPVRPIQQGRSVTVISQDTNHYHFQVSDKTPVKQIIATMDERDRAKNEAMKRAFKSYRDQE